MVTARSVKVMLRNGVNMNNTGPRDVNPTRTAGDARLLGPTRRPPRSARAPLAARSEPAAAGHRAEARQLVVAQAALGTDDHGPRSTYMFARNVRPVRARQLPRAARRRGRRPRARDGHAGDARSVTSSTIGIRARRLCIAASRATARSRATPFAARAASQRTTTRSVRTGVIALHAELGRRRDDVVETALRQRDRERDADAVVDDDAAPDARASSASALGRPSDTVYSRHAPESSAAVTISPGASRRTRCR